MKSHTKAAVLLWLAAWAMGAPALQAQTPQFRTPPHIGYLFPAGAQHGTSCEIVVGGQFLGGIKEILVSGSGVKATVGKYTKPLSMQQLKKFRDTLEEARKKAMEAKDFPFLKGPAGRDEFVRKTLKEAGATDDEITEFLMFRKKEVDPKKQPNLQIAETVTLQLELDPNAAPGPRELRVLAGNGLSNPLAFCVGSLPEQRKAGPLGKTVDTAMKLVLPTVINGQILPGEVDHYAFQARRGAHLVIAVQGRDLIPYLADAVPGWFQPVLALYDAQGREVAYANDYRFSPDPVFCYEVPADGAYLLEIKDALYRGREDFVYRVTVGEIPFVTGIFPMGARAGTACTVDVAGWNLPRTRATVTPKEEGIHRVENLSNGFVIGDVAFASDTLPEILEKEPNNNPKEAQELKLPITINGRIDTPGDVDVFAFSCHAGDKIVAEVVARRLNSPLDSWVKLTDETGLQVAFNDDREDKGSGLLTHQADSYLAYTILADGRYFLTIGDSQHKGGSDYGYRLRISAPQPDFALRIVPSSLNARAGATLPVTVYALRKDGFAGEIKLALKDAPEGFVLQGGSIPAGQDKIRATLTFPPTATPEPVTLALEGSATLGKNTVVRPVIPADDMLQAFIYHHLVPAEALYAVITQGFTRALYQPPTERLELVPGEVTKVILSNPARRQFVPDQMKLQLSDPPTGISVEKISPDPKGLAVTFRTNVKVPPGTRGNLILEALGEIPKGKNNKSLGGSISLGFLPAIPFKVSEH